MTLANLEPYLLSTAIIWVNAFLKLCNHSFMLKFYSKEDYSKEPIRSPDYLINYQTPFNAEPPPHELVSSYITPNEIFYIRNHAPVPNIEDINEYRLIVDGFVKEPHIFTFKDLTSGRKFPILSHIATLMCAGNRRNEMSVIKKVKGVGWNQAALSTAFWTGIRLRDILVQVGANLEDESLHVEFEGLDFHLDHIKYQKDVPDSYDDIPGFKTFLDLKHQDRELAIKMGQNNCVSQLSRYPVYASPLIGYGSSIPMKKAASLDECVMLAWKMNGEALSPDHGYPLRAIVPSYVGARSVKWLWRITVLNHESDNYYQQRDYKVFPLEVDWDTVNQLWDFYPSIQNLEPQAAICSINEISVPPSRNILNPQLLFSILIKGYALSDTGLINVELSLDGGTKWIVPKMFRGPITFTTTISDFNDKYHKQLGNNAYDNYNGSWLLWEYKAIITNSTQIVCRAISFRNNTLIKSTTSETSKFSIQKMPERVESIWNLRGVMNNAWHRVNLIKD